MFLSIFKIITSTTQKSLVKLLLYISLLSLFFLLIYFLFNLFFNNFKAYKHTVKVMSIQKTFMAFKQIQINNGVFAKFEFPNQFLE
jgi:hypothetical protein